MWFFVVQEIMFFGGLFLAFFVYRHMYHEAFKEASTHGLNWKYGAFNTVVLIFSSFTMALAVHAAQLGKRKALMAFLIATMLLGSVFLGVKVVEYSDKFHHHHVPGPNFEFTESSNPHAAQIFFSLYFAMTGLHALHMIIGIGIMLVLLYRAKKGRYSSEYFSPVEMSGLYWHFVDIVWIFLFGMLYLVG